MRQGQGSGRVLITSDTTGTTVDYIQFRGVAF